MAELESWLDGHNVTFGLIEGRNSVFKVECNGATVFERSQEGRFPRYHEIPLRIFRQFLNAENLVPMTRHKWNRILEAKGLTWDQVFVGRNR